MKIPFFGRKDDKPEQKTKVAMRCRIKEISDEIERKQKEACEKVEKMIARANKPHAA